MLGDAFMSKIGSLVLFVCVALGTAGCVAPGTKEHFMNEGLSKAAFDMQCSEAKLDVTALGDDSMGVRGCGKQGRYEFVNGSWVLNSAEDKDRK
jgi:hypothetical protein